MNTVDVKNCPCDLSPESLKTGSIFGALSDSSVSFLIAQGKLLKFKAGERVFEDGDKGDSFYVVLEGRLDYYHQKSDAPTLIRSVWFGEALGYVTMISLSPRLGYAISETDTLLLEIDYNVFGDFHDQFSFDFGILILNLSRDMARNIQVLSRTLSNAGISIDLSKR